MIEFTPPSCHKERYGKLFRVVLEAQCSGDEPLSFGNTGIVTVRCNGVQVADNSEVTLYAQDGRIVELVPRNLLTAISDFIDDHCHEEQCQRLEYLRSIGESDLEEAKNMPRDCTCTVSYLWRNLEKFSPGAFSDDDDFSKL